MIAAESEEEAVRKFGEWKREMETRGLKVNINKTKLMVMGRNLLLGHKGKGTHVGFAAKELEQTQYGANVVKGGATRDVKSEVR